MFQVCANTIECSQFVPIPHTVPSLCKYIRMPQGYPRLPKVTQGYPRLLQDYQRLPKIIGAKHQVYMHASPRNFRNACSLYQDSFIVLCKRSRTKPNWCKADPTYSCTILHTSKGINMLGMRQNSFCNKIHFDTYFDSGFDGCFDACISEYSKSVQIQ